MSKRVQGVLLFIVGLLLALLSLLADAIGLDAPGSLSLAQIQGLILALLSLGLGLFLFFQRPSEQFTSTRSGFTRLDGLSLVDMSQTTGSSGQPAAGQLPVEILDPRMLEQQRPRFIPGQAWRIIRTDDEQKGSD